MGSKVTGMIDVALRALQERDQELCLEVVAAGAEVGRYREDLLGRLIAVGGIGDRRAWVLWMDRIARLFERAGRHAVDITEATWFEITDELREPARPPDAGGPERGLDG
jgi:phosphate uptake regulator